MAFLHIGCARHLQSFVLDFAHAYRHVGVASHRLDFATILLCDLQGNATVASLMTQPFGSSRAPANWARATSFVQFVLLELFNTRLGIYVDDCFGAEPVDTVQSAPNPYGARATGSG